MVGWKLPDDPADLPFSWSFLMPVTDDNACAPMAGLTPFFIVFCFVGVQSSGASCQAGDPADWIQESTLRGHIRFLADDLLEGRGPGSRGDQLTQLYVATGFQTLGLQPAGRAGDWVQPFPLLGVQTECPQEIHFQGSQSVTLGFYRDYIVTSDRAEPVIAVSDAPLVFVGYGIQAPEYDWDDFKSLDVRGKILIVMNNDPADDPDLFEGKRRLYYGRWDYKYSKAAELGAAGAFIIHTESSAGYPYQVVQTSWTGEQFELAESDRPRTKLKGWLTEDAARQVFSAAGLDWDALRGQAERRDFQPVELPTRLSMEVKTRSRQIETGNVLAVLPGTDPELKHQHVVFMAHHDHLGIAAERSATGDNIYNGAIDNASGTAALLTIARACRESGIRPSRSILFAAVGAEEQGLLGSQYFAENSPVPAGHLAAVINMDGLNWLGRTRDVNMIGMGKSSLDEVVQRFAREQGRVVVPDLHPDRGYYYRSDQFSLAKIGVPGIYLHSGLQVIGRPEGWGREQQDRWLKEDYHQVSDKYRDDWDLAGAVEDVQLLLRAGLYLADCSELPDWKPGDEFSAARQRALQAVLEDR